MIVEVVWHKGFRGDYGDRYENIATDLTGKVTTDRQRAIDSAEWSFNHEPDWKCVFLIEIEGETIDDFYDFEEQNNGCLDPFWSLER